MNAHGKVLLITGATGGIGTATARRAHQDGWRLMLVGRSPRVWDLAAELGGPATVCAAIVDADDFEATERAVALGTDVFGRIDGAFINAGINAGPRTYRPGLKPATEELAGWREMILTNVLGTALTIRAVAEALISSQGRLVITGSVLGRYAMSGSLYSATKYAVAGIAETIRLELSGTGVGVTLIEPGPVATGFGGATSPVADFPALSSEDVARTVLFTLTQPSGVDINEILLRPHGATP